MGQLARFLAPDNEVVRPREAARHLGLTAGTDTLRADRDGEAAELAFIEAVIRDLLAFANARVLPAIRHEAEAAAALLDPERSLAAAQNVSSHGHTPEQARSDTQREAAHSAGHYVGGLAEGSAGMCPHLHRQLALRMAWMDGFSAGRAELAQQGRVSS